MRWFLKTLEVIRSDGIVGVHPQTKERVAYKKLGQWADVLERVQPIIFAPKNKVPENLDEMSSKFNEFGPVKMDLDAPFKTFSVEMLDGPITVDSGAETRLDIWCIIVEETAPKEFNFISLISFGNLEYSPTGKNFVAIATNSEGTVVEALLDRLNTEKIGIESTRSPSVKIGTGVEKRSIRVRRIVHVVPQKNYECYSTGARNIDWSHRWLVRGHWRSLKTGLGKDREGNYTVPNFTWVSEYEKGPETAPLISKVRFVRS